MMAKDIIRELPKGLLKWQEFEQGSMALYVTEYTELDQCMSEVLTECGLQADCVPAGQIHSFKAEQTHSLKADGYRYILIASAVELAKTEAELAAMIEAARGLLSKSGKLFLITENRMAIRYFCGDQDPYTGRNFDGIENYKRTGDAKGKTLEGRLYSKGELRDILEKAGFSYYKFYSVFPEITSPQALFAEEYIPNEELGVRIFPQYHNPDTVFLEEESLYTALLKNGLFHTMANGFLIECSVNGDLSQAAQITVSMERGREKALCTIVQKDGIVVKKPLYPEGKKRLKEICDNSRYLEQHGIKMIQPEILNDTLVMPYVRGIPLVSYFRSLIREDTDLFFSQFDRLWDMISHSSEHAPWQEAEVRTEGLGQEDLGVILRRGYIDLVLLNGFFSEGEYIFYDQELYVEKLPAKAVMLRNIDFLYQGDAQIEQLLPKKILLERYGIGGCKKLFQAYIKDFLTKLRNDDILSDYHRAHRRKNIIVHSNRQRMNYSAEEYQRLFVDIFKNMENRRLYLFGSGNFTKKFLALYKDDYEVEGILDNDGKKWGTAMEGIRILAPSVLKGQDASTYKVIICIKNYVGVLKQVRELGASNIGIYDTNIEYPRRQRRTVLQAEAFSAEKKKYHVGYVAGVFDLFHIGHLNLLRRAKEQCDYLIVGVVTDEGVRENKHTESFIPFKERLTIVQACRYVDEAVGIPLEFCDTRDAYLKFQFDVQFSGSDYSKDPAWLKKRDFLREHGAELVFFPYTESTSSTKLKEIIDKKLM